MKWPSTFQIILATAGDSPLNGKNVFFYIIVVNEDSLRINLLFP